MVGPQGEGEARQPLQSQLSPASGRLFEGGSFEVWITRRRASCTSINFVTVGRHTTQRAMLATCCRSKGEAVWASHRSLRRYENGGRLAEVMSRLTPSQVRHAKRQEACLHQDLGTACGRPSKDRVESSLKSFQAAAVFPGVAPSGRRRSDRDRHTSRRRS